MSSEIDKELFSCAYDLAHDNEEEEAKSICLKLVEENPNFHSARMLLASIQADSYDVEEKEKGRENFLLALRSCDIKNLSEGWLEENPIYNLALWEMKNGSENFAIILFLIDYLVIGSKDSLEQLTILSSQLEPKQNSTFNVVMDKIKSRDD